MTYSCAIFKDLDGDLKEQPSSRRKCGGGQDLKCVDELPNTHGYAAEPPQAEVETDELEEAQLRKLDHIICKARIRPGHRVLEIGSGWGSMALRIATTIPDTMIDTITLSCTSKCSHSSVLLRQARTSPHASLFT